MSDKQIVPRSVRRLFPKVKKCIDAKTAVRIDVKKSDCDKATELDPTNCALARAVDRQFHADGAIIGLGASYVIKGSKAIRFATPEKIRREIVSFDRHRDFQPGSYTLVPAAPSARLGRRNTGGSQEPRKTLPRVHKRTARVRIVGEWK